MLNRVKMNNLKANSLKQFFRQKYKALSIPSPLVHFVSGSLMGMAWDHLNKKKDLPSWEKAGQVLFSEVPQLKSPSAPSHVGCYEYWSHKKKGYTLCIQKGRLHGYEGLEPEEVVHSVTGACLAGTRFFVLSNISGGLKKSLTPGRVVAVTDHINWTGKTPIQGACFSDMTHIYHTHLTTSLQKQLKKQKIEVFKGIYAGVLGPQLETPAEVRMMKQVGASAVGMSTIWEAMWLYHLGAKVSCFSVISNLAAGVGSSTTINSNLVQPVLNRFIKAFLTFCENDLMLLK